MGRDLRFIALAVARLISTHTPAWGVTTFQHRLGLVSVISTHTPAWGVTMIMYRIQQLENNFNSHARVGRDPLIYELRMNGKISTHTPAWGVTSDTYK